MGASQNSFVPTANVVLLSRTDVHHRLPLLHQCSWTFLVPVSRALHWGAGGGGAEPASTLTIGQKGELPRRADYNEPGSMGQMFSTGLALNGVGSALTSTFENPRVGSGEE